MGTPTGTPTGKPRDAARGFLGNLPLASTTAAHKASGKVMVVVVAIMQAPTLIVPGATGVSVGMGVTAVPWAQVLVLPLKPEVMCWPSDPTMPLAA